MEQDTSAHIGLPSAKGDESEDGFDPRYLAAKKSIDDRALNRYVWEQLCRALPLTTGAEPMRILEIGAGIGTMLMRVVDWGLLTGPATYVFTDCEASHLRLARDYLSLWAAEKGYALSWSETGNGRLQGATGEIALVAETVRAEELARRTAPAFHLLIAHAVLDLLDLPAVLPGLLAQLTPNGLAYLTCNFDGTTLFLPEYPGEQEKEILNCYHSSMETRRCGASHTGRQLLTLLQRPDLELLAAGSSDWIVHPKATGYTGDETLFLDAIIGTVEQELAKQSPPPSGLAAWARTRHQQVETGGLSFLATNLDLLARRLPPRP